MRAQPTVAVLGAGMQGVTTALELARRGCRVDLFDRGARAITRAGLQNEGKLHLGFVYAGDASRRTTLRLAEGALRFLPLIRRWAGAEANRVRLSSPFLYAVPTDSMLPVDAIHEHFHEVEKSVRQLISCHAGDWSYPYIGAGPLFRPLSASERTRVFSPEMVAAACSTCEVAVEPTSVADVLRTALANERRIRFLPRTEVTSVDPSSHGYAVHSSPSDGRSNQTYDQVVNALWDGRLSIDQGMGLVPRRSWLWRYKAGLRIVLAESTPSTESITFVLGAYGDTVRYQGNMGYASWYPAGMIGSSSDLAPASAWGESASAGEEALVAETFRSLAQLYPEILTLRLGATRVEAVGGVIFAWGKTDIDDPDSELHSRYDVGVTSVGGYHTINTGKYTLAPSLAMDFADRIAPDGAALPT